MNKDLKLKLLYQTAVESKSHEGALIWSRFAGYMAINIIIFGSIGLLLREPKNIYIPITAILGLLLSLLWFLSTMRGFEAIEYWTHCIRELEEHIIENEKFPSLYIRGYSYFKENREVKFFFKNLKEPKFLQRSCITRCSKLNTRATAYFSTILIISIYIIIIILSLFSPNSLPKIY